MPNQSTDPTNSQVSARVPSNVKDGLVKLTNELNGRDPYTNVRQADVIREAIEVYLLEEWEELPEEAREPLDRKQLKEDVEEGLGVEL